MLDSVKHGIGDRRMISDSIIPVVNWQLGCQYYRLSLMAVFDDVQQDGTLLGIQWYEEGIVEDEQLTPLDLLEFSLYRVLGLCHLERTEELLLRHGHQLFRRQTALLIPAHILAHSVGQDGVTKLQKSPRKAIASGGHFYFAAKGQSNFARRGQTRAAFPVRRKMVFLLF